MKIQTLSKILKKLKKTLDAIQQHTFFKEQLKETSKLQKELIKIEDSFIHAMEIRELFNGNVDGIRFKIKELQDAAHIAKAVLELSETEELLLKVIIYSFKIQAMYFLYEYFNHIKLIFSRLPSDEDLKLEAKSSIEEYKLLKEKDMKIFTELSDSSDENENIGQDSEDADDEASEKSNSSSIKSENDCEGLLEVYEDSGNKDDEKSVISVDEMEAQEDIKDIDDVVSDASTKKIIETVYN